MCYKSWQKYQAFFELLKTKYKSLKHKHVLVSICFDNQ